MVDKCFCFIDGVLSGMAEKFLSSRRYGHGLGSKRGGQGNLLEFENGWVGGKESLCKSLFLKYEGKRHKEAKEYEPVPFRILWLQATETDFSYLKSKRNLLAGYDQVAHRFGGNAGRTDLKRLGPGQLWESREWEVTESLLRALLPEQRGFNLFITSAQV